MGKLHWDLFSERRKFFHSSKSPIHLKMTALVVNKWSLVVGLRGELLSNNLMTLLENKQTSKPKYI